MTSRLPFYAQEHDNTCAIACLRMILDFYGLPVPDETAMTQGSQLKAQGLYIADLAELAEKYGLKADIRELIPVAIYELVRQGTIPSFSSSAR